MRRRLLPLEEIRRLFIREFHRRGTDLLEPAAFHYAIDPLDTSSAGLTPAEAEKGRELSPLMAAVLKDAYRANPGRQRVTIRADRESRTRHVVAVMDACNQANIRDYSLAAE